MIFVYNDNLVVIPRTYAGPFRGNYPQDRYVYRNIDANFFKNGVFIAYLNKGNHPQGRINIKEVKKLDIPNELMEILVAHYKLVQYDI